MTNEASPARTIVVQLHWHQEGCRLVWQSMDGFDVRSLARCWTLNEATRRILEVGGDIGRWEQVDFTPMRAVFRTSVRFTF